MRRQIDIEEEDDMLQFAITQSLLESGTEEDQVIQSHVHFSLQFKHKLYPY